MTFQTFHHIVPLSSLFSGLLSWRIWALVTREHLSPSRTTETSVSVSLLMLCCQPRSPSLSPLLGSICLLQDSGEMSPFLFSLPQQPDFLTPPPLRSQCFGFFIYQSIHLSAHPFIHPLIGCDITHSNYKNKLWKQVSLVQNQVPKSNVCNLEVAWLYEALISLSLN